ncbi:hypothetical protein [Aurantimonas endophytica]|uniref:Uncharacterized protein n=1 Tax=Aurantimonas endophytica TaxID=1522175 RepID=A0A7W6MP57_9HYPH|nr:hypothetical protein [Aurantimonas endophytica]MBB4002655.1 hypothetical protein [Aurantimonas endophytica]MCO6403535.1 hypothetical protein [Aurantimonas endophytica]
MSTKDTLPAAVDFKDRGSLADFGAERLNKLSADCDAWCLWMGEFRAGLSTPAGRTEWNVLMRHEQDEVTAAQRRVQDEIIAREDGAPPRPDGEALAGQ